MISLEVGVNGRSDLQEQLEQLKHRASPQQLAKALEAGGEVFKVAIEERTPVRTPGGSKDALPPGALKADIHVATQIKGGKVICHVGPSEDTAYVMRWLEWGHRMVHDGYSKLTERGIRGPGKVSDVSVPAHPVMRPAYEASRDESMKAVIKSLQEQER